MTINKISRAFLLIVTYAVIIVIIEFGSMIGYVYDVYHNKIYWETLGKFLSMTLFDSAYEVNWIAHYMFQRPTPFTNKKFVWIWSIGHEQYRCRKFQTLLRYNKSQTAWATALMFVRKILFRSFVSSDLTWFQNDHGMHAAIFVGFLVREKMYLIFKYVWRSRG